MNLEEMNRPFWHYHRRALKTERGQLFKGHRMELITSSVDKEEGSCIILAQQYYNFNVRQKFLSKENKTEVQLTYTLHPTKTPKWYSELLSDIKQIGGIWSPRLLCINGEYALHFNGHWVYLQRKYEVPGVHMTNHYDNLNTKKEMSKMASRLIHKFKQIPVVDLLSFERDHDKGIIQIPSEFIH
jgi:predicted GH43/DUF377 family glycosyl hydrolase